MTQDKTEMSNGERVLMHLIIFVLTFFTFGIGNVVYENYYQAAVKADQIRPAQAL